MKFRFSLEKVLQHRKTVENLAQVDFQEAVAALHQDEQVLLEMQNAVVESRNKAFAVQTIHPDQALEAAPAKLQKIQEFIQLQGLRIENQKAKIQKAKKLVEEKREILRSRATESKILERLKEKKKAEFIDEMNFREQVEADEMNLMRTRLKDAK